MGAHDCVPTTTTMPSQGPDPASTPRRTPRLIKPVKRAGDNIEVQPTAKKTKTKATNRTDPPVSQDPIPEPSTDTLLTVKKTKKGKKATVTIPQDDAATQAIATPDPTLLQTTTPTTSSLTPPTVVITPTTPVAKNARSKKSTRKKTNSDIAQKGM